MNLDIKLGQNTLSLESRMSRHTATREISSRIRIHEAQYAGDPLRRV